MKSLLIFLINLIYSNGVRPLNSSASNGGNPKVRNHREGLLLVESGYNRFHIFLRHYQDTMLNGF